MSTFGINEVGPMEEIGKSFSFSEVFFICLNKIHISRFLSSLFLIVRGHPGSMHANRECGVIQNEYSYVKGGRESHDMCMYVLALSLFVFWQYRFQMRNLATQTKNLVFRSKTLNFDQNIRYFKHIILKY